MTGLSKNVNSGPRFSSSLQDQTPGPNTRTGRELSGPKSDHHLSAMTVTITHPSGAINFLLSVYFPFSVL